MPKLPDDYQKIYQAEKKFGENFGKEFPHRLGLLDLLKLSLRAFKTRSLRSFLTVLGIAVGIGTVLFLVSLGFGLQYLLLGELAASQDALLSLEVYFPAETELKIQEQDLEEIKKVQGVVELSPVAEFMGEAKIDEMSGMLLVRIIKPNYFRLSGIVPDLGEAFEENEEKMVISSQALKLFNLSVDKETLNKSLKAKIYLPTGEGDKVRIIELEKPLVISGIITDEVSPPFVLIPAQQIPESPPFYQNAFVKVREPKLVEPTRDILLERGYLISARIDLVQQANQILTAATIILGAFGITALLVSAIGMFNTMTITLLERTYEIGIMKSLGATDKDIKKLFLTEAFLMGFFGGLGGLIIGVSVAELFNFGLNFLAVSLGGEAVNLFVRPLWFIFSIVGFSAGIGLFTGYWPARRAVRLSPKMAFKK